MLGSTFVPVHPVNNPVNDLEATLRLLQVIATIIGILGVLGPLGVGWLFWKAAKEFATKEEMDVVRRESIGSISDLGKEVSDLRLEKAQQSIKLDLLLSRVDKMESEIKVELRYIRRDLDMLLDRKSQSRPQT